MCAQINYASSYVVQITHKEKEKQHDEIVRASVSQYQNICIYICIYIFPPFLDLFVEVGAT